VMLLCGADVLASMAVPGVWRNPETLLEEFGVVCLDREGTSLTHALWGNNPLDDGCQRQGQPGEELATSSTGHEMLSRYQKHITLIEVREGEQEGAAPLGGRGVSSSLVRNRLMEGGEITGLVPESVEAYIRDHCLYNSVTRGPDKWMMYRDIS